MSGATGTVFINEFHYDNAGTDTGEFIEIAGPAGTDLTGWSFVLYNGANGTSYGTLALSGILGSQSGGFGFLSVALPSNGLQNGAPDGIALVNGLGEVVQFISYEGTFTAVGGPADGLTSTDIGIAQNGTEPVGSSLHLVGSGDSADDFTWAPTTAGTAGAGNAGQSFTGAVMPGLVVTQSGGSTVVAEGGSNDSVAIVLATQPSANVTVTLSGSPDITLDATTLTFTPANWNLAQQLNIGAVDDAVFEGTEAATIGITLASADVDYNGLAVTPVAVSVTDNDLPPLVAIPEIQGAGHTSCFVGQLVRTTGIVTAVDSNGYYLQDAVGDGNIATSDAVFVFTLSRPTVAAGDAVTVTGTVSEFFPGGASAGNLSTTQITATNAANTVLTSSGNTLPDAVVLGAGGRTPPTEVIDDDALASFDPAADGIDFYESLEAMRVTVPEAKVVAPTNGFGELWVVADNGAGATSLSGRGTLNIEGGTPGAGTTNTIGGDFNPERIQIDDDTGILAGFSTPDADVGDTIAAVTGVVSYSFGNFEILPTATYTVQDGGLARETTSLAASGGNLLVATYNVLNLDPNDADGDRDVANGQFARIAADIVANLGTPDIIALQEVQDSDGSANTAVTNAAATLQALADAIVAAGGPRYSVIDNPFIGDDTIDAGVDRDMVWGGLGQDSILGGDGDDSLWGDEGDDIALGGGLDIAGGNRRDLLVGRAGGDVLEGRNGEDTLRGGGGSDTLLGGNGADLMEGVLGADSLRGGNGSDTLDGGTGNDTLEGGEGGDLFVFGAGSGDDAILDFARADRIRLTDGVTLEDWSIRNLDGDRRLDTLLELSDGSTVTLFDFSVREIGFYVIA
jgi:uncharacterized protein